MSGTIRITSCLSLVCCLAFGGCGVRDPLELGGDSGPEDPNSDVGPGKTTRKKDIGGGHVKKDVGPDCACIVDVGIDYHLDAPCPTELPIGEVCDGFNKAYCGYEVDDSFCECGLKEGWLPETSCWCGVGVWTCETTVCKQCVALDAGTPDDLPDSGNHQDGPIVDVPVFDNDCADVSYFQCGFYAYCDGSTVWADWHEHEFDENDPYDEQIIDYQCGHFCPNGCDDSSFHWPEDGLDLVQTYCLP